MKTETITTPNFKVAIAKIIADIRNHTSLDEIETEIVADILQDALNEQCRMLDGYYEEEYYNAISSARSKAYENGYADCDAKNH